jgi:5-methylcytosine-specific restriction enzyme A
MTIPQKIREALGHLNGSATKSQLTNHILNNWPDENPRSIAGAIVRHTVNNPSRVHFNINKKPRLANTGSPHDFLYQTIEGQIETYKPEKHGIWEIAASPNDRMIVKKVVRISLELSTPGQIRWIKHISNSEVGNAYMHITDQPFVLHYPTRHKGNILKPAIGDILLLYQNIDGQSVFTHLVTPIDYELIPDANRKDYAFGRNVIALAFTGLGSPIPIKETLWKSIRFGGISQGNACRIDHITNVLNVDELQMDTWQHFQPYFLKTAIPSLRATQSIIDELTNIDPNFSVKEGGQRLVTHLARERDRRIIELKKKEALRNNTLFCEACDFSFAEIYQIKYIECHHLDFVGGPNSGERDTTVEDLALVCSNCHRMLHTRINGQYLSVQDLREYIERLKKLKSPHSGIM